MTGSALAVRTVFIRYCFLSFCCKFFYFYTREGGLGGERGNGVAPGRGARMTGSALTSLAKDVDRFDLLLFIVLL